MVSLFDDWKSNNKNRAIELKNKTPIWNDGNSKNRINLDSVLI